VLPAHPLALTPGRQLDERRQRALTRYYAAAGAAGMAVGVHTTQFAIHQPEVGLLHPVLQLAAEEMDCADANRSTPLVRVAGICGPTAQAMAEAHLARELGYQFGLVSLAALTDASLQELLAHCRAIASTIDLFGFYLQPAVGGRDLPYEFWREFCEIPQVAAIKVAPFDRYRTLTVMRAVADSGRTDIALFTGNDDHIVLDLVTPCVIATSSGSVTLRFAGGLLGQWAVWTSRAVSHWQWCRDAAGGGGPLDARLLQLATEVTDANAAIFDAAHGFCGCVPGIHEVLRRQGLLAGAACLDERESLSPGQTAQIDRVCAAYPHLTDDEFVAAHLDDWLSG
jgi:dihydrodipicolinate synthase/N-acetylneuraminate lyase